MLEELNLIVLAAFSNDIARAGASVSHMQKNAGVTEAYAVYLVARRSQGLGDFNDTIDGSFAEKFPEIANLHSLARQTPGFVNSEDIPPMAFQRQKEAEDALNQPPPADPVDPTAGTPTGQPAPMQAPVDPPAPTPAVTPAVDPVPEATTSPTVPQDAAAPSNDPISADAPTAQPDASQPQPDPTPTPDVAPVDPAAAAPTPEAPAAPGAVL